MPSYKLTYFDIKARGEATRLAFHYGGIPFTDERLTFEQFAKIKDFLPFGQVPVLTIDDQTVIAQEAAILCYVGRLTGLYPTDYLEAAKVDMIIGGVDDIYQPITKSFMERDENRKSALRKTTIEELLPKSFGYLDRLVASNKSGYTVGSKLSVADLRIYAVIAWLKTGSVEGIPAQLVDNYPNLIKVYQTVDGHEKIASWNNKQAK